MDCDNDSPAVWVSHPALPGVRLKVRSLANSDFALEVGRRFDQAVPRHKRKTISKRQSRTILAPIAAQVIAKLLLVDWSGVRAKDGSPLPYSLDAAATRMTEDGMFRAMAIACACRVDSDEVLGEIAHGLA